MRIAVVDKEKCQPSKCQQECAKVCPVNRKGEKCIIINSKAEVDELLCLSFCNLCVKKCPFAAVDIVNTPEQLKENPINRFGKNDFVLFRLPFPVAGEVVGLLGQNSLGKTTAVKILSGEIQPNFGEFSKTDEAAFSRLIHIFRGTELQEHLEMLKNKKIKTVSKPQQIDVLSKIDMSAAELLEKYNEKRSNEIIKMLSLESCLGRKLSQLSGGELQRLAIAIAAERKADLYLFDEPSSYLDVFQRLQTAKVIRRLAQEAAVIVVEHDLATLDFLSDKIHIFYGAPSAYGIVSKPYSVKNGVNAFLDGYIKEDNVRIHEPINMQAQHIEQVAQEICVEFTDIEKSYNGFSLSVGQGVIYKGEVLGIFGQNGLGKTTFAKILAGVEKPESGALSRNVSISYKPQYLTAFSGGTVRNMLHNVEDAIIKSLSLEKLMDSDVANLSGGELQRVAVALCLGKEADLYLLDEPSAHLDSLQRMSVAKLIRKICETRTAMVIDHDLLFLSYIADRALLFQGIPGNKGHAEFCSLEQGFNLFLKELDITFRKDSETGRPRANKPGSQKDKEQKAQGKYFLG